MKGKSSKPCVVCKREIQNDGSVEFILMDVCNEPMCMIVRRLQIIKQQQ